MIFEKSRAFGLEGKGSRASVNNREKGSGSVHETEWREAARHA